MNFSAPINSLGYGVCGLNLLLAFEKGGYEPALWPIGPIEAPPEAHWVIGKAIGRQASYDPKRPSLRLYHQFDLAQHVGKGLRCGYPIFELNRFRSNELHHLENQDVLFVTSKWAADVLVRNGIPNDVIRVVPLGVDQNIFWARSNTPADDSETTTFLTIGKWEVRKGHDILIEAFNKAFDNQSDVKLIMHCFNPCFPTKEQLDRYNGEWTRMAKSSPLGDKIEVSERRLKSQEEVSALMETADCGVFPSRAEGWGLETAEMMAMGKQVIVTNYSAHTEYCDKINARLIEIDSLEPAHDGVWFHADRWEGEPGEWAAMGDGQMDQLVQHLRDIDREKKLGCLGRNRAGLQDMKELTWEQTAKNIVMGAVL
jgi:glycosyltransferase involved in cell wall biosynthesis